MESVWQRFLMHLFNRQGSKHTLTKAQHSHLQCKKFCSTIKLGIKCHWAQEINRRSLCSCAEGLSHIWWKFYIELPPPSTESLGVAWLIAVESLERLWLMKPRRRPSEWLLMGRALPERSGNRFLCWQTRKWGSCGVLRRSSVRETNGFWKWWLELWKLLRH